MCNDHDLVGRYLMVQGAPQVAGRFAQEVRAYKAPPPEVSSEAFYETDPTKPYVRGFSLQSVAPLPISYSEHVAGPGHWGAALRGTCATACMVGARCGVRLPTAAGQPGHAGCGGGPARAAGRADELQPV